MRRILWLAAALLLAAAAGWAEGENQPFSFGMQLSVDYHILTGSFSLWNLRYGVGIDCLIHLGSSLYLGAEILANFGFHKLALTDPGFDRIDVAFPFHVTFTAFFSGFSAQLYVGAVYSGWAYLEDGYLYMEDFVFGLYPDVGAKLAWGTVNQLYFKAGYVINGTVYLGLGARLGLF